MLLSGSPPKGKGWRRGGEQPQPGLREAHVPFPASRLAIVSCGPLSSSVGTVPSCPARHAQLQPLVSCSRGRVPPPRRVPHTPFLSACSPPCIVRLPWGVGGWGQREGLAPPREMPQRGSYLSPRAGGGLCPGAVPGSASVPPPRALHPHPRRGLVLGERRWWGRGRSSGTEAQTPRSAILRLEGAAGPPRGGWV